MTWPVYPAATTTPALLRHKARQEGRGETSGPRGSWGAAVDVWRDGTHVWRSYGPEHATTVNDWHFQKWRDQFGTLYPRDYDAGPWRVPGVALDPGDLVPTMDAVRWVGGMRAVCDLAATVLAVGQLPAPPTGLDAVPSEHAIYMGMRYSGERSAIRAFEAGGVSVRLLIAPCRAPADTPPQEPESESILWRVTIERRTTRAGAKDATLPEGSATFRAPADTSPNRLSRIAKAAIGFKGWQTQRQRTHETSPPFVWHTARAPYRMTVAPLTDDGIQG